MGFYGNIANTSRTTFSFDKVYSHYYGLQEAAENDGVFLGRYILIDYDEKPIEGYYYNNKFYTTDAHIPGSEIPGNAGYLYKNLHTALNASGIIFYTFNPSTQSFDGHNNVSSLTTYAQNYHLDVTQMGQSYDNTVWMKQFDTATDTYKYVNIASLNSVVPDLSLIVDAPQPVGLTPFFDAASTNLTYYLHLTPQYGLRIGQAASSVLSDENISYSTAQWSKDASGIAFPLYTTESNVKGNIYYNKAGFNKAIRTTSTEVNTINFETGKSGLTYPLEDNMWSNTNPQANDTYDLKIRLPIIGNAISEVWDSLYGVDANNNRYYKESGVPTEITAAHALNFYVNNSGHYLISLVPSYTQSNTGDFYKFADGTYRLGNFNVCTDTSKRYTQSTVYKAVKLEDIDLMSVCGAIRSTLNLLGTADPDRRDSTTVQGNINIMKDLIANIDTQLMPNRIIETNENGQITTSETDFPHNATAAEGSAVLSGAGTWESRFAKITIQGASTEIEEPTANDGVVTSNIIYNNNVTFKPGNKWISLQVGTDNSPVQISHTLLADNTLRSHDFATDVVIADSIQELNTINSITLPTLALDNAGHVITKGTVSFALPNTFKTITLTTAADNVTTVTNADGSQSADILEDTFTVAMGNKWLQANLSAEDKLVLGHKLSTFDDSSANVSIVNHGTFMTYNTARDEAGHIVGYTQVTNQMPWFYDTIQLENADVQIKSTSSGSLTIATNNWLSLEKTDGQGFKISHITANAVTGEKKINESAVAFGGTFTIPDFTLDAQGHMVGYSTHTITVQTPSLTQTDGQNVVTSVELTNPTTGKFTVTRTNLDAIQLSSFALNTTATGAIVNSDTLATALSRIVNNLATEVQARTDTSTTLDTKINTEIQDRKDAISNLIDGADEGYQTLNDLEGKIKAAVSAAATAVDNLIDNASEDFATLGNIELQIQTVSQDIADEVDNRGDAISAAIDIEVANRDEAIAEAIELEAEERDSAIVTALVPVNTALDNLTSSIEDIQDFLSSMTATREEILGIFA